MKKSTTLEEAIKKRGAVTVEQLSTILDAHKSIIRYRLRKCVREGKIKSYSCSLKSTHGSQKYNASDFFNPAFIGKKIFFTDSIKFAKFFEKNILKFELSKNLSFGKKVSLTRHIKSKLPDKAVKFLRAKYIK